MSGAMRTRWVVVCVSIAAVFATYYSFRLAPKTISGEAFLQLRDGRVVFASAAEVTAFRVDSERGKKWFNYLHFDEKRRENLEMTFNAADSAQVKELRQMLLYGSDFHALGDILLMPASEGGEKIEAICDARGKFHIRLRPASYWIVVRGRAGEVNGIWSKEIDVPDEKRIEFSEGDATFDRPITE
jgi:hypothetical protein